MGNFILNSENRDKLKKIGKKYNLSLILVFGSKINGNHHKNSDLDIGILFEKKVNYKKYSDLYSDLSEIFKGQELDLAFLNYTDPLFLKKILENCKILYGSKRRLNLLKIYAFRAYCDYKKYLDLEKKFVHQFIKNFR